MATIYITQIDHDKISKLLRMKVPHDEFDKALEAELKKAKIVKTKDVPSDAITMNSRVLFEDENGKELEYWLVFPEDADISQNKISVLSPIGCALLGYEVGDNVVLQTPNGDKRKIKVKKVLSQPERENNSKL